MKIIGIDPGLSGGLVFLGKSGFFRAEPMPTIGGQKNAKRDVDFDAVFELLIQYPTATVFLERAYSYGQGSTSSFNYGKGVRSLELAIKIADLEMIEVEPKTWTGFMHKGQDRDLKPKAKSLLAINKLYPHWVAKIPRGPKSGKLDEGLVDACLIAEYGRELLKKSFSK